MCKTTLGFNHFVNDYLEIFNIVQFKKYETDEIYGKYKCSTYVEQT